MITFENFILADGIPIYLQIIRYIKQGIVAGIILNGDELPSRRVLSALLGVNPNTIQKAYAELERRGFLYSVKGKGSFVCFQESILEKKRRKIKEEISENIEEAKLLHIPEDEVVALVKAIYQKERGGVEE